MAEPDAFTSSDLPVKSSTGDNKVANKATKQKPGDKRINIDRNTIEPIIAAVRPLLTGLLEQERARLENQKDAIEVERLRIEVQKEIDLGDQENERLMIAESTKQENAKLVAQKDQIRQALIGMGMVGGFIVLLTTIVGVASGNWMLAAGIVTSFGAVLIAALGGLSAGRYQEIRRQLEDRDQNKE
ncbi:MAG: hypothetical protein AAFV53_16580 [Myxococcota bacterium]